MSQVPVRFLHGYLELDRLSLHYVEAESDSPPMVLLHGIGMDWRVWQAISRRLVPHFRLYMPDLRGHGGTGKPASGYSLGDYAFDIELMLQALGLQAVTLVGSSLGGMVAIVIEADRHLVIRRILVDPPLRRGTGRTRPLFQRILAIKMAGLSQQDQEQAIFEALQSENPNAGRLYLKYMAETWTTTAPGVVREALTPVERQDEIEEALMAIEVPTLIMRGNPELGSVLKAEDADSSARLLPKGEVLYVEGAGHAIHGSQPAQFVDAILRFAAASSRREVRS